MMELLLQVAEVAGIVIGVSMLVLAVLVAGIMAAWGDPD